MQTHYFKLVKSQALHVLTCLHKIVSEASISMSDAVLTGESEEFIPNLIAGH